MTHNLKLYTKYFHGVKSGIKPFDVRKNDRPYAVGDTVVFAEYDPVMCDYTGNTTTKRITYILDDPMYCKDGFVILGLAPERIENEQIR